ncbi:MAG: DUF1493 family protein [Zoogloeaceae bacterium]|jgi:hypothetical protein|nr:DUF1493 family protein [Zoogloeaceae bacterium]
MKNDLESRIIESLSRFTGIDASKISSSSSITDDLGVGGDDGIDLMNEFSREFDVDITNFEFDKYFGHEPGFSFHMLMAILAFGVIGSIIAIISPALFVFLSIIVLLLVRIVYQTSGATSSLAPLTVADLIDLARKE